MKALYLALGRDLSQPDAGTTHTLSIVDALARAGADVTLAAKGFGAKPPRAKTLIVAGLKPFGRQPARSLPAELIAAAREADIIHERAEESGGAGVKLARAAAKPIVLEINTPLSGQKNALLRRLADMNLRRQARAAAAVITQTPIARNIIEGYTQRAVYIVPNGADPEVFSPSVPPADVPGSSGRMVVAFAGSLRPWHGVEDLIIAGAKVLERRGDAFFLVVGGGRRQAELEKMAAAHLGRGGYHFTGAVAPSEVPGYLARADVLAAPFAPGRDRVRRRQFARYGMWWSPVKIFEYMAMERPIVASAAGMIPEYLAGCGATFAVGDASALSATLLEMLAEPRLRADLAAAARKRLVAEYTWERAAERTLAAWREVLTGRQKVSLTE